MRTTCVADQTIITYTQAIIQQHMENRKGWEAMCTAKSRREEEESTYIYRNTERIIIKKHRKK